MPGLTDPPDMAIMSDEGILIEEDASKDVDMEDVDASSDPCLLDSDNDGLSDCAEERLGSDPMREDTDFDGILDAEEVEQGTNPSEYDSDGDLLNDLEERDVLGTDPVNPDTDGDGAIDGEEVRYGFDPLEQSTLDNGVLDGDLLFFNACETSNHLEPYQMFYGQENQSNWHIAASPRFTRWEDVELFDAERLQGASVFDQGEDSTIAGFALSVPTPDQLPIPKLIAPYRTKLASLGTIAQSDYSPEFDSRHGFRTRTATFDVIIPHSVTPTAWRNDVLMSFGNLTPEGIERLLPEASDATEHDRYLVKFSVIERNDHSVVMLSTMPRALHDPHSLMGRDFAQIADASNISVRGSSGRERCITRIFGEEGIDFWDVPPISSTLIVYRSMPDGTGFDWVPPSRVNGFEYDVVTNTLQFYGDYAVHEASMASCSADADCPTPEHERCAHQRCIHRQPPHFAITAATFRAPKWPSYRE